MSPIHRKLHRCTVRPWSLRDLDSLVKHANDDRVSRTLRDHFPHPYTQKDGADYLAIATTDRNVLHQAIEVEGRAVGGIGAIPGRDVHRVRAEIGYWLGYAYWGRGIMTAAVRAVTSHLHNDVGFLRVEAPVFSSNPASGRVLTKAGYSLESTQRRAAIKNGEVLDLWLYVSLAP